MHGQHVDRLSLFMKRGQQLPSLPVWTKNGTQGNRWRLGQVAVKSASQFKVRTKVGGQRFCIYSESCLWFSFAILLQDVIIPV